MKNIIILTASLLCMYFIAPARGKLNILVDERIEMLTVIQYLSEYPVLTPADIKYKKEIAEYFKAYKEHTAVVLNKKIYRRFLGYDAPPTYFYHFSFPDFKQLAPFSKNELDIYEFDKHADTLNLLRAAFRDFYIKSKFHDFYLAHKAFYQTILKPVADKLSATDVVPILENYYGQQNKEYNVVLAPMLHDGGYGPQVKTVQGNIFYAVVGPKYDSKNVPEFDAENIFREYVVHEFSHSFCNPLIDKYYKQLEKDSCLLRPIIKEQEEQGYGSWSTCLYEHLVRANEIILTEKISGKQKADEELKDMADNGKWIYLEGLIRLIKKEYLPHRDKYKTQDVIMPLIIKYFDEEAKKCK